MSRGLGDVYKRQDGKLHETEMWKYWMLQEGVIGVEPDFLKTNDGNQPPVIHVDSTAPLLSLIHI